MRLSVSKIKAFKSCRRFYELHYVEGLTPVKPAESLEIGSNYHSLIEQLYKSGGWLLQRDAGGWTKELAMATAYAKYIYPKFKVKIVEKYVEYDLGGGDKMIGYVDGIAEDGHIVEHKTTGSEITEQYEYNLLWDEQILAYMLMTGKRKVWYTVCRKPTIRQKKDETDEEFFERMVAWYDTDTESKIKLLEIERADAEVADYEVDLHVMLATMQEATQQGNYYRNTCQCNMYGRRCEYSSVCLHYDPKQQYIDFVKEEQYEPAKN